MLQRERHRREFPAYKPRCAASQISAFIACSMRSDCVARFKLTRRSRVGQFQVIAGAESLWYRNELTVDNAGRTAIAEQPSLGQVYDLKEHEMAPILYGCDILKWLTCLRFAASSLSNS